MTRQRIEEILENCPEAKSTVAIKEWRHTDRETGELVIITADEMARLCARGVNIQADPVWL